MYCIADLMVNAQGCGDRFDRQAERYVCDAPRCNKRASTGICKQRAQADAAADLADISVCVTEAILCSAQSEVCGMSEDDCRYILSGLEFYVKLLGYNGLMLHSSAVVTDGVAYLFSASSGVGKSTHAGLWLQMLGEAAYILNDDKPAIRYIDESWYAYGTPWSGKCDISRNERARVGGIAFIERSDSNSIKRVYGAEAIALVLEQTVRHIKSERLVKLLELIPKLTEELPIYSLRCRADISAAELSYKIMSKGVVR